MAATDTLGELLDLAKAIGLVTPAGDLNPEWFTNPGKFAGQVLRAKPQRDALLRMVDTLLGDDADGFTDAEGRQWIPVVAQGGVALHVVVEAKATDTRLGIGASLRSQGPDARVDLLAPLLLVPNDAAQPVKPLPNTADGRVRLRGDVELDGAQPAPGEAALQGIALDVGVNMDGTVPAVAVLLRGLQLPGEKAPHDVRVDTSSSPAQLGDQALKLVLGVVQSALPGASGPLKQLLGLLGLDGSGPVQGLAGDGGAIPSLPLADVLGRGVPAWRDWLAGLLSDPAAIDAWLAKLAELAGHGATVVPPASAGEPHRVRWTLANGLTVEATLRAGKNAAGAPQVELGAAARAAVTATLPAGVELEAGLVRITLGTTPALRALPRLDLLARLGAPTGAKLVDATTPRIVRAQLLRAGFALDEGRKPVFVLAAQAVQIASRTYPVLDLTDTDALADVGGTVVSDLLSSLLGKLGPAEVAVRVLTGLSPPPGPRWPVPLVQAVEFLSDPPAAVAAYHARVLATNRALYPQVLAPLAGLLSPSGGDASESVAAPRAAGEDAGAPGDEDNPWTIPLAAGVALTAWGDSDLHIGLAIDRSVSELGGGCPTAALTLTAELVRVHLLTRRAEALPQASARLRFGARGGVPLRIGASDAALIAQTIGLALDWSSGRPLAARLDAPGLQAVIDGEPAPLELPRLGAGGALDGAVPWRALELLTAHVLERTGLQWAIDLVSLLGWRPDRTGGAGGRVRLPLSDLIADPLPALRDWALSTARPRLAGWLSLLITGPAGPGLSAGALTGRGDAEDPFAVALSAATAGGPRSASLLLWDRAARRADVDLYRAEPLIAWLSGQGVQPTAEDLAAALAVAGYAGPALSDALAARADVAGGLAGLAAAWTDSDGLVPRTSVNLPGAVLHELGGVPHQALPAALDLQATLGIAPGPAVVFVTGPFGAPAWPGVPAAKVLDLTARGLPPEAFEVSAAAAQDGPWAVRLPSRADAVVTAGQDGPAAQAARLARVVDAVIARRAGGGPVVLVAHGAAGHAAALVAATRTGITHLVTVGTPHAGAAALGVLDAQPSADALRLLAALVPPPDPDRPEHPLVELGRGLLAPLLTAFDAPSADSELAPPSVAPTLPPTVAVHCVRGRVDSVTTSQALTGLVVRALEAAYDEDSAAAPDPAGADGLATGLLVRLLPQATAGAVSVRTDLSLALPGPGTPPGAGRGLRATVDVERPGGWLVGGPGSARPPALRRATFELDLPVGRSARARIVLHEGEALGLRRRRWEFGAESGPLLPEGRVLLGCLAGALGPLPLSGPVRDLVDLLAALGLTEPGTSATTGAPVSLAADGVQRLLVDPRGLVRAADPVAVAVPLARMLGAPAPVGARFTAQVDGLRLDGDVAAGTLQIDGTQTLASGARVRGSLSVGPGAALAGSAGVALGGRSSIELDASPPRARLVLSGGEAGLPSEAALYPDPDGAAIARILVRAAEAEVLWAGVAFLRALRPASVGALVDPLLRALGLLGSDGRQLLPVGPLADPARWIGAVTAPPIVSRPALTADGVATGAERASTFGKLTDPIAALLDAAGALLGIPRPRAGAWSLPYGLELSAVRSGTRERIALTLGPQSAGVIVSGSFALLVAQGQPAIPQLDLTLAVPGAGGSLTLSLAGSGMQARLRAPSLGVDVVLLPPGPGIASAAATRALPLLLDAIAALPVGSPGRPVGQALGALGDVLKLRTGGAFSAAELSAFGAAPGQQLATRLAANPAAGFAALRDLLAPAVPAMLALGASATGLTLARAGQSTFSLGLTVAGGGLKLSGSLAGLHPFASATLDGEVALDATGLSLARAGLTVVPPAFLALGDVRLSPVAGVAAGPAAPGGPQLFAGLAADASRSLVGVLRPGPPRTFAVEGRNAPIGTVAAELLVPLALNLAAHTPAIGPLLSRPLLHGKDLRALLDGVVFTAGAIDPGVGRIAETWPRVLKLAGNLAREAPSLALDPLTVNLASRTDGNDDLFSVGVSLAAGQRLDLLGGDLPVQLEVDSSWLQPTTPSGLSLDLLRIPKTPGAAPKPAFGMALRGLGLRIARRQGPLLDTFVVTDSVAVHGLIEVSGQGVTAAGGQLQLSGLAVAVGSANDGDNKLASGILRDSAGGPERLAPKFSPALAVVRTSTSTSVALRAGAGAGPWMIPIQRGFGPVYVEQVGLGVTQANNTLDSLRLLVDGRVSLLGLAVAVDDLALIVKWPSTINDKPIYDPGAWKVGLAGLAISADMSGVSIAGGLRRVDPAVPDYIGMITLRFGPYGLSAFGGYAAGDFTSLFIFGALNAPIGGPPAFFVTGIGAGVGINRLLKLPPDLAALPDYPLVHAFRGGAQTDDPGAALTKLRDVFPPERGSFWFAAGVSFTSFALVDCIAVLGVAISDGLELTLMGVARAALPTTAFPLAQLELALLVRFSTRDGVLWVQGQLTDNSWLLTKDVRLTGGFAYVSWFAGDKQGEFVLTLGGYHPSFHRDGYPVVPRVGFRWGAGNALVVKGESYFALTSEAIMAGTRLEASLKAGPLWAYLRLGADGIVYFDPFKYQVSAFAEIGAGITIDINLGFGHIRITIGLELHADVTIAGPNFHGTATIDLGVASATISFGDATDKSTLPPAWPAFSQKYLQAGNASVLTVQPGRGQVAPKPEAAPRKAPTGAPGDPFLLAQQFELTVTSTAAITGIQAGGALATGADPLAIGPMHVAGLSSVLTVSVIGTAGEQVQKLTRTPLTGQVPRGIWGPQPADKPLPTGETLKAGTGLRLAGFVNLSASVCNIDYHQVEVGNRLPLPFLTVTATLAPAPPRAAPPAGDAATVLTEARRRLDGRLSPHVVATFASRRVAPPQLAELDHGLGGEPPAAVATPPPRRRTARAPRLPQPPRVHSVLTLAGAPPAPTGRTTVGAAGSGHPRAIPPRLTRRRTGATLVTDGAGPPPAQPRAAGEVRRRPALPPRAAARLAAAGGTPRRSAAPVAPITVAAGEIVVLEIPNADRDVRPRRPALLVQGGPTRVVLLDTVGSVVGDVVISHGALPLPPPTARVALLGGGGPLDGALPLPPLTARVALLGGGGPLDGAPGWYASSQLAQLGSRALAGPGCTVTTTALSTWRGGLPVSTGLVKAAAAVRGLSIVTTRLPAGLSSLAILLEGDPEAAATLELGLTGARIAGPPVLVRDGVQRLAVHPLEPVDAAPVELTVAAGPEVDVSGVLGSRLGARHLAEALRRRSPGELLGTLVPTPGGRAQVRWLEEAR